MPRRRAVRAPRRVKNYNAKLKRKKLKDVDLKLIVGANTYSRDNIDMRRRGARRR